MDSKEVNKIINNVWASFQIDNIEVSFEFICNVKEKMLKNLGNNKEMGKRLVKREKR